MLISLSLNGYSQATGPFPSIDESDLPDASFKAARVYTGASLFGYINGGAELFREYGFSDAWVTEIHYMDGKFLTEIYRMTGPEEAFGIYSVSRYRCMNTTSLSPFSCQTPYQWQICKGPYYISIVNSTGSSTDSIASLKIGQAIVRKISESAADIRYYLPGVSTESINREALLVRGELGFMNGAPEIGAYLGEASGYYAVIMQQENQTVVSVRFLSREGLAAFVSGKGWYPALKADGTTIALSGETVSMISENHLLIRLPLK
jgi:hypothetical protein